MLATYWSAHKFILTLSGQRSRHHSDVDGCKITTIFPFLQESATTGRNPKCYGGYYCAPRQLGKLV